MKIQNVVRILMLLAILGIVLFPVAHLNAEVVEKNTEAIVETEEKSESTKPSDDVEVDVETEVKFVETEAKLEEVFDKITEAIKGLEDLNTDGILDKEKIDVDALLEKIKEQFSSLKDIEGVTVEISEPTVIFDSSLESEELKELKEKIKKLEEDGNLDSDELVKQLKKLVADMKIVKAADSDGNIVTVLKYGPYVTTKGNKELEKKIKELASDETLDSDELAKKVQELVKGMKSDPIIVHDKDNLKVYQYGPYITTKVLKDGINFKELGEKISKLAKSEDLESAELAKKVMELISGAMPHKSADIIRGDVKVIPLEPSKSLRTVNDSNIEKLEKRVEKLETKIDKLIEKISKLNPEKSEDE